MAPTPVAVLAGHNELGSGKTKLATHFCGWPIAGVAPDRRCVSMAQVLEESFGFLAETFVSVGGGIHG
jgi:hypothetical protein